MTKITYELRQQIKQARSEQVRADLLAKQSSWRQLDARMTKLNKEIKEQEKYKETRRKRRAKATAVR